MKKKVNKERVWMIILAITALIFLVIGVVKIVEKDYLMATTSLITTLAFLLTTISILKGKLKFNNPNDGLKIFFPVGFVFTVAGGSGYLNAGIWGFGLTLFIVGLMFSPKNDEALEEKEDVG